ncbi:MAG TPA: IS4 family transposase [Anaerolineales bacterium]
MGRKRRKPVCEADLRGFKYFQMLMPLLERLHDVGTARDRAGNRQLFFDQYTVLLLLYFFSPIVVSLRALQQASGLDKVQRFFGIRRVSLGSLSEATEVFDAEPLRHIVQELAERAVPLEHGVAAEALRALTAVDGTILRALPKMLWALWQDSEHRAIKVHLHFDVLKGVPCDATITPAACSEPAQLQAMLQPGRLYVTDRGYASYELFRDILEARSSFVGRVQDNTAFGFKEDRPLTEEDRAAGVIRDALLFRLGTTYGVNSLYHPLRLVIVQRIKPDHTVENIWLITDRLDLTAELIALAYRYRWTVELFFRWLKCILGYRHLLSHNAKGVAIQCYAALIASLLVVLWTGHKPTRRTWEMIQFYLMGWATLEEVQAHLDNLDKLKAREKSA